MRADTLIATATAAGWQDDSAHAPRRFSLMLSREHRDAILGVCVPSDGSRVQWSVAPEGPSAALPGTVRGFASTAAEAMQAAITASAVSAGRLF